MQNTSLINQILGKVFDFFKTKYPHQYAILIIVLGGLAALATWVPTVSAHLPAWVTTALQIIALAYAAVGGAHTSQGNAPVSNPEK